MIKIRGSKYRHLAGFQSGWDREATGLFNHNLRILGLNHLIGREIVSHGVRGNPFGITPKDPAGEILNFLRQRGRDQHHLALVLVRLIQDQFLVGRSDLSLEP